MSEILWVGVGFDPTVDGEDFDEQHDVICSICCDIQQGGITEVTTRLATGADTDEYAVPNMGTVIDIFDAMGSRIGFGIRLGSIAEGRLKIASTKAWMRGEGVVLPIGVYAWSGRTAAPEVYTTTTTV